ncbi:MAG: 2-C-methyl-D-erythritol 4-phosphate cytidylyltransferase [Egibacteraceae bacterium]
MSEQRVGVVVAAGTGERFGHDLPKAFVRLGDESLLVRSCQVMRQVCGRLVVVVGDDWRSQAGHMLASAGIKAWICGGGATRTDSVAAGLAACETLEPSDLVGIHDAARPLASAALISRVFAAVRDGWDAAAPGLPVVDTLKLVGEDGAVVRTVDRGRLWTVQTPQVFRWAALARAYQVPDQATDDLGLVERIGCRVRLIMGESTNLKITYRQDLELAEALLGRGCS